MKDTDTEEELWEIDSDISISIDLVDHILEFCFSRILTQRSHHSAEFLSVDAKDTLVVIEPSPFLSKRANASLN